MLSARETILTALYARLSMLPARALRGDVLPERIPAEGLLILRDGDPGEPEVTLSPLAYHYQHRAEIEAVVQGVDRDVGFDILCASVGAALPKTELWVDFVIGLKWRRHNPSICRSTVVQASRQL